MIRAEIAPDGLRVTLEVEHGMASMGLTLSRNDAAVLAAEIGRLLAEPEHRGEPVDDA